MLTDFIFSPPTLKQISTSQVQPDMEELTDNAEENEEEGSKQSEQKLGKLQYKVSAKFLSLYQFY